MTDEEAIARFLADRGPTKCPPGWAAETSNALPVAPATKPLPKRRRHAWRRPAKKENRDWAYGH